MSTNVLSGKPVFFIRVKALGARFYLKINEISVMRQFDPLGQVETTIPVNHWMHPENNVMGLKVYPDEPGAKFDPRSYVNMELWVKDFENEGQDLLISSIYFSGTGSEGASHISESTEAGRFNSKDSFAVDKNGDVSVDEIAVLGAAGFEGALIFSRSIFAPLPLPLWKFFDSDTLPNYDDMSDDQYFAAIDDLFVEYKKVQDALLAGDVDTVISAVGERNRETDLAFYLELGTTENRLRASLEQALRDDNMELADLLPDYLSIRVEDNRKLVRLVRGGDTTAIGFDFKSFPGSESYDFIFRRENGKWIVTR